MNSNAYCTGCDICEISTEMRGVGAAAERAELPSDRYSSRNESRRAAEPIPAFQGRFVSSTLK